MARIESWFKQDLQKPVQVHGISGNLFSADNQGNLIGVEVFNGGEPVTLSGTVSANVIRPDGGTVAVTGLYTGNRAYVILPAAAYAYPGIETIVLKLTESGVVTTLAAVVVTIYQSSTSTVVDPGTIIPSIETLISQIQTAVASIPADYSSLWTTLAPAYTQKPYSVGQYCTNGGVYYRCIVPIETGESFNSAHWKTTNIGDDLSALKSALSAEDIKTNEQHFLVNYNYNMPADLAQGSSYAGVGIKRHGPICVLNGTAGTSSDIRVRLNGTVTRTNVDSSVAGWNVDTVKFVNGHKYNAQVRILSGTAIRNESNYCPAIAIYKTGSSSSVGNATRTTDLYVREFTADDSQYNVALAFANGLALTNCIVLVTITDMTLQRMNSVQSVVDKSLYNRFESKNLMGMEIDYYYPVSIPKGSSITVSTSDGKNFKDYMYLYFYDINKTQITYYRMGSTQSQRTVTVNSDTYYLRWGINSNANSQNLMVAISDSALPYESYIPNTHYLDEKLDDYWNRNSIMALNRDANDASVTAVSAYGHYGYSHKIFPQFMICTDVHSSWGALRRCFEFNDQAQYSSLTVCMGDICDSPNQLSFDWEGTVLNYTKPIIGMLGNHDAAVVGGTDYKTTEFLYEYLFSDNLQAHNGETHDGESIYWYKDIEKTYTTGGGSVTKKLRIISLNQFEQTEISAGRSNICYSQAEIDWLLGVLDTCDSNTYVIICSHCSPTFNVVAQESKWHTPMVTSINSTIYSRQGDPDMLCKIINGFIHGGTVEITNEQTNGDTISVSHTFLGNGKFVGWLAGHTHKDSYFKPTNYADQKIVIFNCTSDFDTQQEGDIGRGSGKTADCVTLVSYDWDRDKIRLVRVGACITMTGENRLYSEL